MRRHAPPGRSAALRSGRYPQPPQYPPHRRGADADTQATQFTLDAPVAPARVLPRHLPDQRQLAVAADAELRRRHPGQHFSPLGSAEPEPATGAQRDELTLTPDQPPGEIDQWITGLAAGHRTFADGLADRQSQMIPSENPGYGDLGPAFPAWTSPGREPILQPPKPEIPPSPQILQLAMDRAADWEAAD